jgi:hypothetical protein
MEKFMQRIEYFGNSCLGWIEKPALAASNSTDTIFRVTKTTVNEIDIHISNGDVPEVMENLILTHEGLILPDDGYPGISILNVTNKTFISYHILRK